MDVSEHPELRGRARGGPRTEQGQEDEEGADSHSDIDRQGQTLPLHLQTAGSIQSAVLFPPPWENEAFCRVGVTGMGPLRSAPIPDDPLILYLLFQALQPRILGKEP